MGRHNGTADDDGELVAASYPAELLINPNENDERGRRGLQVVVERDPHGY